MSPHAGTSRRGSAIALLVLLLLGGLLVPSSASAQGAPLLCFEVERGVGVEGVEALNCQPNDSNAPNFLQGAAIGIVLKNVPGAPFVEVRCLTECRDTQNERYFAQWNADKGVLVFPRDFREPGPNQDGGNPVLRRAPRYNGTWEVTVHGTPLERTFNVWLFDRYLSPGLVVSPGERHVIQAAGFDEGAQVSFQIQRRVAANKWETIYQPGGSRIVFTHGGFTNHVWFPEPWTLDKTEARRIKQCQPLEGCYRMVVQGAGKADEHVPFTVDVATLRLDHSNSVGNGIGSPPGTQPATLERTRQVLVAVDFHYPGGSLFLGEPLRENDVRPSGLTGDRTLRVRLERVNLTGVLPIQDLPMRYHGVNARWEATWTVPKDFPLPSQEPNSHYRLRLLPQEDEHGNLIPETSLANYTIQAARLEPVAVHRLQTLGRTEEGNFTFAIRYHNGTPVTPQDLAKPLKGCFYRESAERIRCPNAQDRVDGVFENGAWTFKVRYPRTYEHLEAHKFLLYGDGEGADKWGNQVVPHATAPFTVEAAEPRVEFSTILRGRDSGILERGGGQGNHVSVQARVTYADGTPFNHQVTKDNVRVITGALTKTAGGVTLSHQPFQLREADAGRGLWLGDVWLTADDATTPLGTWRWEFEFRDNLTVPNAVNASFERVVKGIPLRIEAVRQPFALVETGALQTFRFRVRYEDGAPVPHENLVDRLQVHVYRYNPSNSSAWGNPLSGRLTPLHDAHNGWYEVEFQVPNNLFTGTYAFVVSGGDRHGNLLAVDAWSRPFATTSRVLDRPVLAQPAPEVLRGESATVVFDAREGDVGVHGTGAPVVRVQRYDPSSGAWVFDSADVRQTSPGLPDHVGLFPVLTTTPVGLYRFVFEGRDERLQQIVAHSQNFTVVPTDVARAIFAPPPEKVAKGGSVSFSVERQEGDRYTDVDVMFNGRSQIVVDGQPLSLPVPIFIPSGTFVNVTWEPPFDAPSGNYSIRVMGRDLYGNRIEVLSPAIEIEPAQLSGRILGHPTRSIQRGEGATLLFGITYPTGAFYLAPQPPRVNVVGPDGNVVGQAAVRAERGATYAASWTPGADAPLGDYAFEVSGTGVGGNAFPSLRSSAFRVSPGTLTRAPAVEVGASLERMSTAVFAVPFDPRDESAAFTLSYYGPANDATAAVFETAEPQTRIPLAHTMEPETGRYVTRFVTDHQTPPGLYRIHMSGEDGHGNRIESRSAVITLRPTNVVVILDPTPPDSEFGDGKTITLSFVTRYRSGTHMDDTMGRPSAVVLYTAPGGSPLPVTDRPTLEFRGGRWYATWTAPDPLPEGIYEFSFGGADASGNVIASSKSRAFPVTSTLAGSAAKLVPGPGAADLVIVALAAAAVVALARRPRRDDD